MTIKAILAHDDNFGIGKENGLPWPRNSADMKWFRECTHGHVVIMGRKTWESLGCKKLPNRINVVVTRSNVEGSPDMKYYGEMNDLLQMIKKKFPDLIIWVIGGADIFRQALPYCESVYVTEIKGNFDCDVFVDMNKYLQGFSELASRSQEDLTFRIWKRI